MLLINHALANNINNHFDQFTCRCRAIQGAWKLLIFGIVNSKPSIYLKGHDSQASHPVCSLPAVVLDDS